MSSVFGSSECDSLNSEPLPDRGRFNAEAAACEVVQRLIGRTFQRLARKAAFCETLNRYSKHKTTLNMREVSGMHFLDCREGRSPIPRDQVEPKPLLADSMLPTAAGLDRENSYGRQMEELLKMKMTQTGSFRKKEKKQEEEEEEKTSGAS